MRINQTYNLFDFYFNPKLKTQPLQKHTLETKKISSQITKTVVRHKDTFEMSGASSEDYDVISNRFDHSKLPKTTPGGTKMKYDPNFDYSCEGGYDLDKCMDILDRRASGEIITDDELRYTYWIHPDTRSEVNRLFCLSTFSGEVGKWIEKNGIDLGEDGKFSVEISPAKIVTVTGIEDDESKQKLEKFLSDNSAALRACYHGSTLPNYMNISHEKRSMSKAIGDVEYLLKKLNYDVNIGDLKLDTDGKLVGLPDDLSELINDAGPSDGPISDFAYIKNCLNLILPYMEQKGFDSLPRYNYYYTYENGKFTAVDRAY